MREPPAHTKIIRRFHSVWFPALNGLAFGVTLWVSFAIYPAYGILSAWAFTMTATLSGLSPRRTALLFSLPTMLGYAWLQRWLIGITVPGYLGLVVVMSALLGLTMWLATRAARKSCSIALGALSAAALLAAFEFARGRFIFSGYPWYLVGQPTIDVAGVPALASWIGMHGVNALVCVVGALYVLIYARIMRSNIEEPLARFELRARAAIFAILLMLPVMWGPILANLLAEERPAPITQGVPIAVVQTNVPQSNKQSSSPDERVDQFVNAVALTRDASERAFAALGEPPAFIAWPETMFPAAALNTDAVDALRDAPAQYFAMTGPMRDSLVMLQASLGVPMLVGAMALENPRVVDAEEEGYVRLEHDGSFNSVFLVREGGVDAVRYDKIHLTPFGEVMPLISRSDWLERHLLALGAPGMSFDLTPGKARTRFEIDDLRVATPICFEATMPHVCRALVFEGGERRANMLLNVTNDGWFGRFESGRRDHLLLARWRAAELATPVVRAANTGMSCFIDANGRVYTRETDEGMQPGRPGGRLSSSLAFNEAALFARVVPGTGTTLYARTGDVVGWTVFAGGSVLAVFALWPRKNRANRPASPNAVHASPD